MNRSLVRFGEANSFRRIWNAKTQRSRRRSGQIFEKCTKGAPGLCKCLQSNERLSEVSVLVQKWCNFGATIRPGRQTVTARISTNERHTAAAMVGCICVPARFTGCLSVHFTSTHVSTCCNFTVKLLKCQRCKSNRLSGQERHVGA
jgi:hypothetical protein